MGVKKIYAVRRGRETGIFDSWKECQKQVSGYSGSEFKSFLNTEEALEYLQKKEQKVDKKAIKVYTDGACSGNGTPSAKAGIGIFFKEGDSRNFSGQVRGKQTNNVAEVKAIIKVYQILKKEINNGKSVIIYSDSRYAIRAATDYGRKQEEKDWKNDIPNKDLVKKIYNLYKDKQNVDFRYIAAHTGLDDPDSKGNAEADRLAVMAITN
jgi:ribonuclease HI